jgi:hypothetical protein
MNCFTRKKLKLIVETCYVDPEDWTTHTANGRVSKMKSILKNAQSLFHIQIAIDKILFPRITGVKKTEDA